MNICVFCSSCNSIDELYKKAAFRLGEMIAENGNVLVYGGATGGLMSEIAEGASNKNGDITGVIAKPIIKMNRQSKLPTQMIIVGSMAERKQKMKEIADVFVVLPGGYGTLDEMFDVVASGTVGEHKKPLILVNQNDFYDHFLKEIEVMKNESCIPEQESYRIHIVSDIYKCTELVSQILT